MPYDPAGSLAVGQNPFAGSGASDLARIMQQARLQLESQPQRLAPQDDGRPIPGDVNAALPEAYADSNVGMGAHVKHMIESLMSLPKRAIDASAGDMQNLGDHSQAPQSIGPALETALLTMGGGVGGTGEGAGVALGSGPARMRMVDNVDLYKELANQRRAQGFSVGKAAPGHDFKRPDAEKGSWADLVARTKAGWEGDKARAVAGYEDAAPAAAPKGSPLMTQADWDFIKQNGGLSVLAAPVGFGTLADQGRNN
jgi:hypothetical protein